MVNTNREQRRDPPPPEPISLDDIVTVDAFAKRYPDIADARRLRWMIYNRASNGLEKSGAIVKKHGRWCIVAPRFRDWLLTP